VKLELKHS